MIPGARLIMLGRQGAGKGTQCVRLSRHYVVPHISTGEMLRAAVKEGTALGVEARSHMERGELLPDEVMIAIVQQRLSRDDTRTRGYILDGFPRTLAQADALDAMLDELGFGLDAVVEFAVADEVVVGRLLGRGRSDDREDVIRNRQKVYRDETAPLLDHYRAKLVSVDAVGTVDEVAQRLVDALPRV